MSGAGPATPSRSALADSGFGRKPRADPQPFSPQGYRALTVATFLLAASISCCWQALAQVGQPTRAVAWGGAGLATYAASLLYLIGHGQGRSLGLSRWRLGSWSLLWYGAAFGLTAMTWVQPQTGSAAEIALPSVLRALWLAAVGMTLWFLGYAVGPGQPARRAGLAVIAALDRRFLATVRSPLAPWILYGTGTAARLLFAAATGLYGYVGNAQSAVTSASGYQEWLNVLTSCAPLGLTAAALQVYRERLPGARVTLAVLFVAEIAFSATTGYKQGFIVTILAVAVPFTMSGRRIRKGPLIAVVLLFGLVVIPFNQAYRNVARGVSGTLSAGQAVGAAPGVLGQVLGNRDVGGTLVSSASYLLVRIRDIDSLAIIMQRTPGQIPYSSPAQLAEEPLVRLIPRAVWPGKPIFDSGYTFSQEYYDLPSTVITSSAITPLGDLYRHGGWIPVIAGMFLLGCGTRLLDDAMDVPGNPHAAFLFVLLFPELAHQEVDWSQLFASLPGIALVWLFAVYLTFGRNQDGHQA